MAFEILGPLVLRLRAEGLAQEVAHGILTFSGWQLAQIDQIRSTKRREEIDGELHLLPAERDPVTAVGFVDCVECVAAERARFANVRLTPLGHRRTEIIGHAGEQTLGHGHVEIVAAAGVLPAKERHQHT